MTYNIKYDNPQDSINNWNNRKKEMVELFKYYGPDIFGIQEGQLHQLSYISDHLPEYSMIGVGRDDGKKKGEFSSIYYNHEKFELEKESTFWLSETSDVPSMGWDAAYKRVCTYGLFKDKNTNQRFFVFNTHFDHVGVTARENSADLIIKKIKEINVDNLPVVLMGDFNSEPDDAPIKTILKDLTDGSTLAPDGIYGPHGTFTGFKENIIPENRIDFIFIKGFNVTKYRHIDDRQKNNNYISDHLPVLIDFK